MIPVSFIISLIDEREDQREKAISEVSSKWANPQLIYGPVLTIPFKHEIMEDGKIKILKEEAHILPAMITINNEVEPQTLRRGIYEVVVYDSKILINGNFTGINDYLAGLQNHDILWDEAFLTIHISDLRGIKEKAFVTWNGKNISAEPGSRIPQLIESGITVNYIFRGKPQEDEYHFSVNLSLQGSQHLGFVPLGKETHVKLNSPWQDPSFSGSFLPDERRVGPQGFNAGYTILELNRNYPQFWIGNQHNDDINKSAFGVDLLLPVNDYQKSMRSAKYALLIIALTFLTFFLVEIFNNKRVHPFQYILIGLALCLFYTLLISLSEHINFNLAYLIASLSVITITAFYAFAVLKSSRQTSILIAVLCLSYSFVYVTLQLQDYALLIGSIGLTAILALTMYITRNINWYELSSPGNPNSSAA